MEHITKSTRETKELGKKLGSSLKGGEVIALSGDLGAGKTTFVQGLAKGLGISARITSPTFILMRVHGVPQSPNGIKELYHVDLYRLEEDIESEVEKLGLTDFWGKQENVVVVEWAEKASKIFPRNTINIDFEMLQEGTRKITITK